MIHLLQKRFSCTSNQDTINAAMSKKKKKKNKPAEKSYIQPQSQNCKVPGNQNWGSNESPFAIFRVTGNVATPVKQMSKLYPPWNRTHSEGNYRLLTSHIKYFVQKH